MAKPSYEQLREKADRLERELSQLKASSSGGDALRNFLEGLDLISVILDRDGIVMFCNRRCLEISGYEPGRLIGKNWFDTCIPPGKRDSVKSKYRDAIGRTVAPPLFYENEMVTGSGDTRFIAWHTIPLPANDGIAGMINIGVDITDRKLAEDSLRRSEGKYRELVENANSIILRMDPTGRVLFFNEYGLRFFGYRSDEIIGRSVVGTIVPERESTGRDLAAMIEDLCKNPDSFSANENENMRKDGSRVWISWTNKAVNDNAGKTVEVLCVGNDITDRRRIEEALRESEEKFSIAFQRSPLLLAISSIKDGRFIDVNDRFLEVIGCRREEVIGKTSRDLALFANPDERDMAIKQIAETGHITNHVVHIRTCRGEIKRGLFNAEIINLRDKKYLLTMMRDVTELKRAEEEIRLKEGVLRSMFDATPAGVGLLVGRKFKNVNAALCRMTGYSQEELLGQYTRILYPDDGEYERVGTALYGQMEREGLGMQEALLRRKDGSLFNVLLSLSPFNPKDFSEGVTATVLDISDFKRTEERLQESERRYRLLAENARDVIWLSDLDLKIRYISPSVEHLVGLTPEEMMALGFDKLVVPESQTAMNELFEKNMAIEQNRSGDPSRTITAELEFKRRDGTTVWTESLVGFQRDDKGRPRSIVGITRDIADRKAANERLRGQLALNMALAGLAGSIISRSFSLPDIASIVLEYARVLTDSEHGFVTEIDPVTGDNIILSTSKMPGAERPGILHKIPAGLPDGAVRTYPGLWGHALNTRRPFFTNAPEQHPSWRDMAEGHPVFHRFLSVPVIFDDKPVGEIGVADGAHDYTDDDLLVARRLASLYAMAINRIRSEEELNNSLREKEILIKELHHRVKNNLQVISSLLSLQSRKVDDERYRALFQESQNRIHAMALVHEKLYHSEVMSKIDFGKYINELTQHLFYSYNINRHLVRLDLDVKEVLLGIDIAVPIAMIVNELVSNSLKHAFPEGRTGVVSVSLSRGEGGRHMIIVSDDGIGMPGDFDVQKSNSLGMQIVQSLTRQIKGNIDISRVEGTRVAIVF